MATVFAAPSHADADTDFAERLHGYGIYGARDYNAWIGKLTCKRLLNGIDHNAVDSAAFVGKNLDGSDAEQAWQFVGSALSAYCPEQLVVLQQAGGQQ
ncbi:DUF732 domain-containing protein [Mycolicibacter minnesotensis]|uniref:DUF732 domain-containing protein n=1 Tax=Mycolicibacter minnesotensis TaxID=1118379 RepID=UPI003899511E